MNLRIFRSLSVKCARLNPNPSRNITLFKPLYVSSSVTKLKFFEPEYLDVSIIMQNSMLINKMCTDLNQLNVVGFS